MLEVVVGALFKLSPKKIHRVVFTVGQEEIHYLTANVDNPFDRKIDFENYSVPFRIEGTAKEQISVTFENLLKVGTPYAATQDLDLRGRMHIDRYNNGTKLSRIVARLG